MTLSELQRILREYQRAYGDQYVVLADDSTIIGDCNSVGLDPSGDIILSIVD